MSSDFRILVVGASGTFGRRLVRLLGVEPGIALVLGGRRRGPLEALAAEVRGEVAVLDRDTLDADALSALRVDLVIDAAGPFDASALSLPRAAIAAKIHYVDLADSRSFVAALPVLDADARAAGVAVLGGASSTPALSHAVFDTLCAGWRRIDPLRVTISPSNRQPRGRAVVDAILRGVGQPLQTFRDGAVVAGSGWGGTRRVAMPGIGMRWASWCDTPDMDLLRTRYVPRVAAEFLASLELPIMHLSLVVLGWIVRRGWLRSALPLAGPLIWLADRLERFGSKSGGMVAEAKGVDADGTPVIARWWLHARGNAGPNVPVLAALGVARKLRDGTLCMRGAGACVGVLGLDDFAGDLEALGIETGIIVDRPVSPFVAALGVRFARLPAETRRVHAPAPVLTMTGEADVEGAATAIGRFLARAFGFPPAGRRVPLRVVIEADADANSDGGERWTRIYSDQAMRSRMTAPDPLRETVEERFGPFRFTLALTPDARGIDMRLAEWAIGPVKMPRWLAPRIAAREDAAGGRHLFDVSVAAPLLGTLVRYRGWLDTADLNPVTAPTPDLISARR